MSESKVLPPFSNHLNIWKCWWREKKKKWYHTLTTYLPISSQTRFNLCSIPRTANLRAPWDPDKPSNCQGSKLCWPKQSSLWEQHDISGTSVAERQACRRSQPYTGARVQRRSLVWMMRSRRASTGHNFYKITHGWFMTTSIIITTTTVIFIIMW